MHPENNAYLALVRVGDGKHPKTVRRRQRVRRDVRNVLRTLDDEVLDQPVDTGILVRRLDAAEDRRPDRCRL